MIGTITARQSANGRLARFLPFGFALLLITVNGVLASGYVYEFHQARVQADRSLRIQQMLQRIEDSCERSGEAQRSYRLFGDERQLAQYRAASDQLPVRLARLRDLIGSEEPERFERLAMLIEQDQAQLAATMTPVNQNAGTGELPPDVAAGMERTQGIVGTVDAMFADEQTLLSRHLAEVESRDAIALGIGMVVRAIAIAAFVVIIVVMFRRARRNEQLADAHSRALRESEQRFRRIFEESPLGMLLAEDDGDRIVQANPAFCRMLGTETALVVGKAIAELAHVHDRQALSDAIRGGTHPDVGIEARYVTRSGAIAWASVRTTRLSASDSGPGLLLALVEDTTREKRVEAELRQAQKMEAIGQLTGGIAHDFNNLLGIIIGNVEFLIDTARDPEQATLAQEILSSALSGADLTRRLLAFARRQTLQPRRLDLNAYLPSRIVTLRRLLGESITISTTLAQDLWPVRVDPSQIGDALLNLAINARDAMPHGGTLTIATANAHLADGQPDGDAAAGDHVVLAVTDTGIGMPPELLERVVEPFFTTKPVGAGSGLGLSMVFGFAKQSGGHLRIQSAVGHGTTVSLFLPRASAPPPPQEADGATELPVPYGDESILLVDDNASMRTVARRHLVSLGYRVSEAGSGPAALEVLQSGESYDLLLTDVVMPDGMTEYQLAAAARAFLPDLRILFTTGYVRPEPADAPAHPAGATLRKPYRRQELAAIVRAALDA